MRSSSANRRGGREDGRRQPVGEERLFGRSLYIWGRDLLFTVGAGPLGWCELLRATAPSPHDVERDEQPGRETSPPVASKLAEARPVAEPVVKVNLGAEVVADDVVRPALRDGLDEVTHVDPGARVVAEGLGARAGRRVEGHPPRPRLVVDVGLHPRVRIAFADRVVVPEAVVLAADEAGHVAGGDSELAKHQRHRRGEELAVPPLRDEEEVVERLAAPAGGRDSDRSGNRDVGGPRGRAPCATWWADRRPIYVRGSRRCAAAKREARGSVLARSRGADRR